MIFRDNLGFDGGDLKTDRNGGGHGGNMERGSRSMSGGQAQLGLVSFDETDTCSHPLSSSCKGGPPLAI